MKRFLITSTRFTGTAELFFNKEKVLCRIDCRDTDMNADMMKAFKAAVPVLEENIPLFATSPSVSRIVEAGYRVSFDEWWKNYNKKINKARCIPLFDRLDDAETIEANEGIKPYDLFLAELKGVRQKLDPENYLKQKAWNNQWK